MRLPNNDNKVWKYLDAYCPSLRIALHGAPKSRWVYTTVSERDRTLDYNHRNVLENEVVLDFDNEDIETNYREMTDVSEKLRSKGIKHSVWFSGGRGYHIHVLWAGVESFKDRRLIKEIIHDYISFGYILDTQVIHNHLIRMEWGLYEKKFQDDIVKTPLYHIEDHFVENEIPSSIVSVYVNKRLRALAPAKRRLPKRTDVPPCVKYFLSDKFVGKKDGRRRALFIVASHNRDMERTELFKFLRSLSLRLGCTTTDAAYLWSVVNSVKASSSHIGCRYRHSILKELGENEVIRECEAQEALLERADSQGTHCNAARNSREEPKRHGNVLPPETA